MISLTSPKWRDLEHAYGSAEDVPELLKRLESFTPDEGYQSEPFFSLWSALCHQGEVYSASFAAVPHIVEFAGNNPERADWNCILLPTSIEIARVEASEPMLPAFLADDYHAAIQQLPNVIAEMRRADADENLAVSAAAGIAVVFGHPQLAKATLELSSDVIPEFIDWLKNR